MSETSIASARASVMIYDDLNKKWIPNGTSSGLSKIHIFKHVVNNTFRVVGRKLQDHEVVINCVILKSLKYNQATTTFHQWRDNKNIYGLNFSSKEDADTFAQAMIYALEVLNSVSRNNVNNHIVQPVPVVYQQSNGQFDEDIEYRSVTKENAVIQDKNVSQQNQFNNVTNGLQVTPNSTLGHHRTSSAPSGIVPAPPPLPGNLSRPISNEEPNNTNGVIDQSSLTFQLQAARLKRTNKQPPENSGSSTSSASSGGSGNYSTLSRNSNVGQTGMASIMDEMARTLARRRAAKKEPNDCSQAENVSSEKANLNRNNVQKNSLNGSESPKLYRKQMSSTEDLMASNKSFGDNCISNLSLELETLKQDILCEIREDLNKMKIDIIESLKSEIGKR